MKAPLLIRQAFPMRPSDVHKYLVGTVAVVGGSECYPHAPVIAALGARSGGAGLVRLVVPDVSRYAAGALVPESTLARLGARFELPPCEVAVAGMGLGRNRTAGSVVAKLLASEVVRLVLDADALAVLARRGRGVGVGRELVVTPHEGEAARLLGCTREEVAADRRSAACELAGRYGATVVLKGERTLVVSSDAKRVYENRAGNPFMALGGMGDLLAGVIGARWAYLKGDAFVAAAGGVWLHSAASDGLVAAKGDPSLVNTAARIGSLRVRMELAGFSKKGETK